MTNAQTNHAPTPRDGSLAGCATCGGEVQFNGWFWQHTDGSGAHPADPRSCAFNDGEPCAGVGCICDRWRRSSVT